MMGPRPTENDMRRRAEEIRRQYERDLKPRTKAESRAELSRMTGGKLDALMDQVDAIVANAPTRKPNAEIMSNGFGTPDNARVNYTAENHQYWRKATAEDACGTIVYCAYDKVFGDLDDTEEEPDEEFPDEMCTMAIVYTQDGRQRISSSLSSDGVFDDLHVVPDTVLRGVKNEAPPGKFYSGKSILNSSDWSPAPDGMVWLEDPRIQDGSRYCTDFEYYILSRMLDLGLSGSDMDTWLNPELEFWKTSGSIQYWCPVTKQFLCEGERRRSPHWFHNGDGSAQKRRYYWQWEMFNKYGGWEDVGRTEAVSAAAAGKRKRGDSEEVIIEHVKTLAEVLEDKRKKAEKEGKVISID
mmetsp:Transcript_18499/g.40061  ORF Transcript_18499/g.40061 Transcript_18499/m.40061 type:complete len:354 (-) Transcript_18499:71-1132(-)|eukprot:CAMPEP_0178622982 /NCGR_PEP_ID=MMETSP0698-20121128/6606_1 /TAXON_ID=265572 /ORGANISM="Extubocellulus spinifer, Strain CCMP396" /LENGTH=353 /DNA_ID=CAMNT_0020262057 /DNA_START=37 /DNA_END=1098 /DNA_ORIENTATION=+